MNRVGKGGGVRRGEFTFASPRGSIVITFTGGNLLTDPHLACNNALRRLMLAQGLGGELLLRVLDKMEALGAHKYNIYKLRSMIFKYPKAPEFDTVVKSALLNWTTAVASNLVRYDVSNGFDIWRKLCHRCN